MKNKPLKNKLGIFGFGCVGQGLYDVLQAVEQAGIEVARICVKDKEKPRNLPSSAFTYDPQELLQDETITILAELISDADEAYSIVKQALQAGKTIVSANKKMLAMHLPKLIELQQKYNGTLLYEAAVGGSIPIIRTLESYYSSEPLEQVSGILNGSSNYILSKMEAEGVSYNSALKQAQDLGFAEADPTLDVGGYDTVNKLCLIAAHAFGAIVKPKDVLRFGIDTISETDLTIAKSINSRIRLVSTAALQNGQLYLSVLPTFVPASHDLFHVENETNGITIVPEFAGEQFLKGRGAGSHPTGSAVWADVSAAIAGYKYTYAKAGAKAVVQNQEKQISLYLRVPAGASLPETIKPELQLVQEHNGNSTYTATLALRQLLELQPYFAVNKVFVAEIGNTDAALIALQHKDAEALAY